MEMFNKNSKQSISFEKVAIIYNKDVEESYFTAKVVFEVLDKSKISSFLVSSCSEKQEASFVITIGGDGTLLKAARCYPETPIFGVNLGRLGFLAQSNPSEIEYAIEKLLDGKYHIEKRMMLSAFDEKVTALNDMVIKGDTFSRTSRLFLSVNDKPVCDYLADGIIISTPTGSTAYALSAGGPVISPGVNALVIVPICPHTLTSRPLVIPADEVVKISSCKTCNKMKLSADGQNALDIDSSEFVTIKRSQKEANLVILNRENDGFYGVLREKLQWGVAPKA